MGFDLSDQFVQGMNNHFKKQFPSNQDFLDISIRNGNTLKISGFKHNQVQIQVAKFVEKMKYYQFPYHWENLIELIEGAENCMVISVGNRR